jgi:hypothetical protein
VNCINLGIQLFHIGKKVMPDLSAANLDCSDCMDTGIWLSISATMKAKKTKIRI